MLLCIIQARTGSTRFPNKVLTKMDDKTGDTMVKAVYRICKSVLQNVVVAIPIGDKTLKKHLYTNNMPYFEGPEDDVLKRFYMCATTYDASHIVRVTADCPFLWPDSLYYMSNKMLSENVHFGSNAFGDRTYPDGTDIEVMTYKCLSWLNAKAKDQADREHVTKYLYDHIDEFHRDLGSAVKFNLPVNLSHIKFSIDTPEELAKWTQQSKN